MGRYLVQDPATREIEIDESALPFWQGREGYTVIGPVPEPGVKSAQLPTEPAPPDESSNPTTTRKAASRPAQSVEGAGR
ncbi:hypothetical protein OIE13_22310 [Streptosporangium sp. NBC_01810]|uniref:hypothetical protein n=1 Tax=Streptosporangium sp. NBC_01810 TaxID=2975951 RepID=UPI002DD83EBC|nr:hypothetical protein [Streptosporangium sp. NBC_01810]WSA23677.1 hypothetical protein OIE13_22310 [Streptosporangium sp. NBC_01810]